MFFKFMLLVGELLNVSLVCYFPTLVGSYIVDAKASPRRTCLAGVAACTLRLINYRKGKGESTPTFVFRCLQAPQAVEILRER